VHQTKGISNILVIASGYVEEREWQTRTPFQEGNVMTRVRLGTLFFIVMLALGGAGSAIAQDATPSAEGAVLPAHIHAGTCDEIGDVVFPLENVQLAPTEGEAATPPSQPAMVHADFVLTSVTELDVTIDELLADDHVINVHASPDDMGTYVACGQIEGQVRLHLRSDAPPGLVIPLRELNDSGYAGVAWISPNDDGGTTVTLFVAEGLIGRGPR
jgi:hypothetical protein